MAGALRDEDYQELLRLRTGLRRFLHQSETWAKEAGLTPAQHQLMLAIRGHPINGRPTISDVAGYLLLRHHSVVELVDRAVLAGLVKRDQDSNDARLVRLSLTPSGHRCLERLSERNLGELRRLADHFRPLLASLDDQTVRPDLENSQMPRDTVEYDVQVVRAYDRPTGLGQRVLVDRLWPRGMKKEDALFDRWCRDIAPSTELRRWYGHEPKRFAEFAKRYAAEIRQDHANELDGLVDSALKGPLFLVTATKDVPHSGAFVLEREVRRRFQNRKKRGATKVRPPR